MNPATQRLFMFAQAQPHARSALILVAVVSLYLGNLIACTDIDDALAFIKDHLGDAGVSGVDGYRGII